MPVTVEEFRDLVRILEEKPEWRAELRRLVLTEELLSLPEQLAALRAETERRFQEMAATVDKLAREVARLGIGMGDLQRTQKRLIIDVADLKGDSLERRYRERAPAYFGGLIRRARALTTEDLDEMLEPAVDLGRLSDAEANKADRPSRRSGGRRMPTECRSPIRRASPVSTPIRSAATTCKGTSSTRWKSTRRGSSGLLITEDG